MYAFIYLVGRNHEELGGASIHAEDAAIRGHDREGRAESRLHPLVFRVPVICHDDLHEGGGFHLAVEEVERVLGLGVGLEELVREMEKLLGVVG